jgi:hypothetical protein
MQPATVTLSNPDVATVLHPSPPLNFHVTAVSASTEGHQLLLTGYSSEVRKIRGRNVEITQLANCWQAVAAAVGISSQSSQLDVAWEH